MGQRDSEPDFLDLACLAYQGADSPQRRSTASTMLSKDPSLGAATMAGAAATGNVGAIRSHLGADSTTHSAPSGSRSWPPILYLCYARIPPQDAIGSLDALLDAGADPNAHFVAWGARFTGVTGAIGQGEQGSTRLPSHPDAESLVRRLIDAGASPNDCQALYNTMLGGDVEWLRLFLSKGLKAEDPITWPIDGGARSLDFVLANAVDHGDLVRVDLLLSHGANPNCVNTYNRTHVYANALVGGHDAVAERLVAAGAHSAALDEGQKLERALRMRDLKTARSLLTPEALDNPKYILRASDRGDIETVRLLLECGADVNGTDDGGATALHRAAQSDRVEVVRLLLASGADPSLRERNHNATAFGFATYNSCLAAAAVLKAFE